MLYSVAFVYDRLLAILQLINSRYQALSRIMAVNPVWYDKFLIMRHHQIKYLFN